jgi:esterase FrsA
LIEFKANLTDRLDNHKAPFHAADADAARAAIARLENMDGAHWALVWSDAAAPFEARGKEREAAGDTSAARDAYFAAYGLLHVGRFPTPNHPAKLENYVRSVAAYRAAGRYFSPPVEPIDVPFAGKPGEGNRVIFYVRRPKATAPLPVIVRWGGIDTWKEDRHDINERILAAGFASINADMPGVGESPVIGSIDAERQFLPVLDWIKTQPDLDAKRVIVVGMSYGGYWATKVAHMYADRLCGAVNWGGGIDQFFTRAWIEKSKSAGSYLMDIAPARARTVGGTTYEEYIERVAGFSLVAQGLLDKPHPPMLVVNGRHDEQVPMDDMIMMLEHGKPKAARFFPGGHMGYGPNTLPAVIAWLQQTAGIA